MDTTEDLVVKMSNQTTAVSISVDVVIQYILLRCHSEPLRYASN